MFQARSRAPAVVSTCLLVAVALQVWAYFRPAERGAHEQHRLASHATPAASFDVATIMGSHLFGQAEATTGEPQATNLTWTLSATFASDRPEEGMAVVSDGQQQHLYRPGDGMPGGAVLRLVYPRRIVFELGGSLQELSFPLRPLPQGPVPSLAALSISGIVEPLRQQVEPDMRTAQEVAAGSTEWHIPPGPDDPPGG